MALQDLLKTTPHSCVFYVQCLDTNPRSLSHLSFRFPRLCEYTLCNWTVKYPIQYLYDMNESDKLELDEQHHSFGLDYTAKS